MPCFDSSSAMSASVSTIVTIEALMQPVTLMEAPRSEMMIVEVVKFPLMMVGEETVIVDWLMDE